MLQVTPWVLTPDVNAMARFFVDVLGVRACIKSWDFAYLERDAVAIRVGKLSDAPSEERVEVGERAWRFYVELQDVDALVAEVRPKLLAAGMAGGEGPVDQSWGQREFWAPVPGGGFIVFGQKIVPMQETAQRNSQGALE